MHPEELSFSLSAAQAAAAAAAEAPAAKRVRFSDDTSASGEIDHFLFGSWNKKQFLIRIVILQTDPQRQLRHELRMLQMLMLSFSTD